LVQVKWTDKERKFHLVFLSSIAEQLI